MKKIQHGKYSFKILGLHLMNKLDQLRQVKIDYLFICSLYWMDFINIYDIII